MISTSYNLQILQKSSNTQQTRTYVYSLVFSVDDQTKLACHKRLWGWGSCRASITDIDFCHPFQSGFSPIGTSNVVYYMIHGYFFSGLSRFFLLSTTSDGCGITLTLPIFTEKHTSSNRSVSIPVSYLTKLVYIGSSVKLWRTRLAINYVESGNFEIIADMYRNSWWRKWESHNGRSEKNAVTNLLLSEM